MKMIPENEVEKAALNDTKSIDRTDGFKAGVTFAESKIHEYIKDIIIENQGLKLYKDNEAKRFEEIAIEFAKYLFSSEITRNSSKEDEMVYTPPEFNLMKGNLIKNGKEIFNNFLKEKEMTRYKLKQWYPSLPKDWEVGQELIKYKAYNNIPNYIPEECIPIAFKIKGVSEYEVENNPDFWEKLEEKEYEIIKENYNTLIGKWEIHSVKRLSDGEIFSVGDRVTWSKGKADYAPWLIDNFFIKPNNLLLVRGKNNLICEWIEEIKKTKEPILITEDGVEIFKGDTYWRLIAVIEKYRTFIFLEKSDEKGAFPYRGGGGKFFSTEEAAEKYLNENKPMYSKKDMLSFGASMSSKLYPYQCEGCLEHWKRFKKEKGE